MLTRLAKFFGPAISLSTCAASWAQPTEPTASAPETELRAWFPASVHRQTDASIAESHTPLAVAFGETELDLTLEPHSVRAPGFQLLVQAEEGELVEEVAEAARTLRGRVEGREDSRVAVTEREGSYWATIYLGAGEWWFVEPLENPQVAAGEGELAYAAYQRSDILPGPWECGGAESHGAHGEQFLAEPLAVAGSALRVTDLAIDTDVEYFLSNGSSVSATLDDVESLVNGLSLLYELEVGISYELTSVVVRTQEADPYSSTNHSTLLQQFRSTWNASMDGVRRDIAHLLTGKNIDGSVIGVAYLDTICQMCGDAAGYGLSQTKFSSLLGRRICLTAHELGHNWGAGHCDGQPDCGLMCSSLGGCSGACDDFGATTAALIATRSSADFCLALQGPPASAPFCEKFDAPLTSLSWSYVGGAEIVSSTMAPSPPGVVRLDDCCTACAAAPDEIRSNTIPLSSAVGPVIAYWARHTGGGAMSQLVVEYQDSLGGWTELDRITPQEAPEVFARRMHDVPADALHDEFRLRFRLDPASDQEEWYLDDVSVETGAAGSCGYIVTLSDFADWEFCAAGPDRTMVDPWCSVLDFDGDGELDLRDVQKLQNTWAGF